MYLQELQMCSEKTHMARNSKNYCRCNVFFRPLRQINPQINKCHVEAFPFLWSKNRVFYCLIKTHRSVIPLIHPSSHTVQLKRLWAWKARFPTFPFSITCTQSLLLWDWLCSEGFKLGKSLVKAQLLEYGWHDEKWQGWAFVPKLEALASVLWLHREVHNPMDMFAVRHRLGGLSASLGYLCRIWCWWLRLCRVAEGEEDPERVWDCSLKGDAWVEGCRQLLPTCEQCSLLLRSWSCTRTLKNNFVLKQSVPLGMYLLLLGWAFAKCYLIETQYKIPAPDACGSWSKNNQNLSLEPHASFATGSVTALEL